MKWMRKLGFAGWTTSASLLLPVMPERCGPEWIDEPDAQSGAAGNSIAPAQSGVAGNSIAPAQSGAGGSSATAGGTASSASNCGGTLPAAAGQSGTNGSGPICGNGRIDSGEACDDGSENGASTRCDASCAFICVGSCPIRVDPQAASNGSGSSWLDPSNRLQDALSAQSNRGGGEVWVRTGSFVATDVTGNSFVSIPSHVTLRGGFSGTEWSPAQRPTGSVTSLVGIGASEVSAPLLRIEAATNVLVERMQFSGGEPSFQINDSQGVTLREISVRPNDEFWTQYSLTVRGSAARFEHCDLVLPQNGQGLLIADSDVAILDSRIDSDEVSTLSPKLWAESGRVLIQNTVSLRGIIVDDRAEGLIVDTQLLNTWAPGASLYLDGKAAIIETDFGPGYGSASLNVAATATALVFNSSFIGIRVTATRGSFPTSWGIEGAGSVSVSLSTFRSGQCDYADAPDCRPIQQANIDNSEFDAGQPLVPSNCSTGSCTDAGDANLLDQSRRRVLDFAAPFQAEPFRVDLSRYADENFWVRERTDSASACGDTNAPDPGRHFVCAM